MSDGALETLLSVTNKEIQGHVLFLNARTHPDLPQGICVQQYFRPYAAALEGCGFEVFSDMPDSLYDCVWILAPKNTVEAQYLLACGGALLRPGGVLYAAADNKAGGRRLEGWMAALGFEDVQGESRNKARVCRGVKVEDSFGEALRAGEVREILGGRFVSQPGVFGWDKIDAGSEILTQHLPHDLSGICADFGCGYGYLSDFLLRHCAGVEHLYCIDADWRTVQLCEKNLAQYDMEKTFLWRDLTHVWANLSSLDFIIMNPPFHEGKKQDILVGQAFIETAAASLRKKGVLWMVANAHLPYEAGLKDNFSDISKIYEGKGFKVFCALK